MDPFRSTDRSRSRDPSRNTVSVRGRDPSHGAARHGRDPSHGAAHGHSMDPSSRKDHSMDPSHGAAVRGRSRGPSGSTGQRSGKDLSRDWALCRKKALFRGKVLSRGTDRRRGRDPFRHAYHLRHRGVSGRVLHRVSHHATAYSGHNNTCGNRGSCTSAARSGHSDNIRFSCAIHLPFAHGVSIDTVCCGEIPRSLSDHIPFLFRRRFSSAIRRRLRARRQKFDKLRPKHYISCPVEGE